MQLVFQNKEQVNVELNSPAYQSTFFTEVPTELKDPFYTYRNCGRSGIIKDKQNLVERIKLQILPFVHPMRKRKA